MPNDQFKIEDLPKYKCHKVVGALLIKEINFLDNGNYLITPTEDGLTSFEVTKEFINRHNPNVGDYFVVYQDGYESISPPDAFSGGYTLIEPDK